MSYQNQNPYAAPMTPPTLPEAKPESGRLATRGERFAGSFIDGLIMLPLAFGLGMALGLALVAAGLTPDSAAFQVGSAVAGIFIGGGLFTGMHGYLLATRGQTIGKYLIGTKIVTDDGHKMPLGELILKRYVPLWVVTSIPYVGGIFGIVNALAIFRESHKCIHDDIAGTIVIKI